MKADIKFFLVIIILIISTKIANANSEIKIGLLAPFSGEFKNIGDSVFDPFLGTGTTAVVSKKLGRNYCGIEKDKTYFNAAKERINKAMKIEDDYLDTIQNNKSKPRIPFGSLVELGIIKPGTSLMDPKKRINAKIMADGSIKYKESEGSIHKVAAKIMGIESCNGWTYWHYNLNGSTVVIDNLRQKFIAEKQS